MENGRLRRASQFNKTRFRFVGKGLLVGAFTGLVVSLFRLAIEKGLAFVITIYQGLNAHPWYWVPLVGANLLIGLLVAQLLKKEPNISGSGIPQVEGQLEGEFDFNWWSILWRKFVGGILSIAPGLFLGREGPSIQLGAAVGQGVAAKLLNRGADRRILIASGAAAGLSAAFNAPIAGTFFVLEEIYHNFSPLVWVTSLASAIAANFISLNFFGLTPTLHITYSQSLPINQYWHLLILGVVLGLLGYAYQKVLLWLPQLYVKIPLPKAYTGLVPLLCVLPIGYFWPEILGGGNGLIAHLGQNLPTISVVAGLFLLRFVFSMISYGSGLPGGIFLPILSLGALIGALYGLIMVQLGWLAPVYVPNLIIFAMGGYFAGIGKAPFTAILLVTEMVGSLVHLMPLAILSLVAYIVVDLMGGAPIYASLLQRALGKPHRKLATFSDRLEVPVFAGAPLEDRQVREVDWPKTCLLIAIVRGESELIPHGDTLIRAGDTLIVLTDHQLRATVRRQIEDAAQALRNTDENLVK
ncbi:ClC family H(+)/Cl(-) exchange transporter [Latilactobacillus curvatus]|uniref:ClC family H(+)/Cl(-) exchange transporter n=1 Tax=Latilactobacillus curvatus TaxID=28038 RepID=UPI0020C794A8|nr:ClC family H(+)/Cl(-) exchange transporter [Latilactobacillus curvatus]